MLAVDCIQLGIGELLLEVGSMLLLLGQLNPLLLGLGLGWEPPVAAVAVVIAVITVTTASAARCGAAFCWLLLNQDGN
jgi:hypothetical protein